MKPNIGLEWLKAAQEPHKYPHRRETLKYKEVRVLLIAFAGPGYGMGHYYRSLAVLEVAQTYGVSAYLMSNYDKEVSFQLTSLDQHALIEQAISFTGANWVVLDIPYSPPVELVDFIHARGARVALLDGARSIEEMNGADFAWNQTACHRAILRPSVLTSPRKRVHPGNKWFVWGGAEDKLGLCQKFVDWTDLPAWIMTTDMMPKVKERGNPAQVVLLAGDESVVHMMSLSTNAVVHHGMICWELLHLGVRQHVFSATEDHLHDALNMQEQLHVLAYPKIGLPDTREEFLTFLKTSYDFPSKYPQGNGARSFIYDIMYITTTGKYREGSPIVG